MRLSQLNPETEYATCDGRLIKVMTPVSNKWTLVPVLDDKGNEVVDEHGHATLKHGSLPTESREDPWAACTTTSQHSRKRPKGVLVEYFTFDEDGKPLESQGKTILPASGITGLWSDYLLLHGERVREEFRSTQRRREDVKKLKALRRRLGESGLVFPRGDVKRIDWQRPGGGDTLSTRETSSMGVDIYDIFRPPTQHPMYGKLPEDYPYCTFDMNIRARNETDVEHLLDVIEAGVKHLASLEKRREREARQRALKHVAATGKKPAKKTK